MESFTEFLAAQRLRAGPLAPHLDALAAVLTQRGYAATTAKEQVRLAAHLGRWLDHRQLRAADLDESGIADFLRYRRRSGRAGRSNGATLRAAVVGRPEIDALLASPDRSSWAGRRDYALLLLAVQTGLRVSELIALRVQDVVFGTGAHVRCAGKGRKERCTPLRKETADVLRVWVRERGALPAAPLFPNARGAALSRDGVQYLLAKHVATAGQRCPSLAKKRVSPHVLRHSTAMDLLQHGVDRSVIALWLGYESAETTQIYLAADLEMKERALAKAAPLRARTGRFRPGDRLLAFLNGL